MTSLCPSTDLCFRTDFFPILLLSTQNRMRSLSIILPALCCTSCQHSPRTLNAPPVHISPTLAADQHQDYESHFEGTTCFFNLTNVDWEKQSSWRPESEVLPLPPGKAEAGAITAARRLRPDIREWSCEFLWLERVNANAWFYVVSLCRGDAPSAGLPDFLTIPVLLDGRAVEPGVRR